MPSCAMPTSGILFVLGVLFGLGIAVVCAKHQEEKSDG